MHEEEPVVVSKARESIDISLLGAGNEWIILMSHGSWERTSKSYTMILCLGRGLSALEM
jgi:hypothetical protein